MTATFDREYVNDMVGENQRECENCGRLTHEYVLLDFGKQGVWVVCEDCRDGWRDADVA